MSRRLFALVVQQELGPQWQVVAAGVVAAGVVAAGVVAAGVVAADTWGDT